MRILGIGCDLICQEFAIHWNMLIGMVFERPLKVT